MHYILNLWCFASLQTCQPSGSFQEPHKEIHRGISVPLHLLQVSPFSVALELAPNGTWLLSSVVHPLFYLTSFSTSAPNKMEHIFSLRRLESKFHKFELKFSQSLLSSLLLFLHLSTSKQPWGPPRIKLHS